MKKRAVIRIDSENFRYSLKSLFPARFKYLPKKADWPKLFTLPLAENYELVRIYWYVVDSLRFMTDEFISETARAKPRVLLCEGTPMTPDPEKHYSEDEVYENVKGIIKRSEGLVLSEFSMCNIDQFHSIFKAAQDAGRTVSAANSATH